MGKQRFFAFLVLYRWISLVVPLGALLATLPFTPPFRTSVGAFALATAHTLFITLFHRRLNRLVLQYPYLLGFDFLLSSALIRLSGGIVSPYYLYALSPLMAGAFFFQYWGAICAPAAFTPLYLGAVLPGFSWDQAPVLATQLAGVWLLPALIAYPVHLLRQLQDAHAELQQARDNLAHRHAELQQAHQQLRIIHDLTLSLQAAPDVETVQRRVLEAVTQDLGFPRAVIGLVNPISQRVERWRAAPEEAFPAPPNVTFSLSTARVPLVQWIVQQEMRWWQGVPPLTGHEALDSWLGPGPWLILPLQLREHPVGVLLIASEAPPDMLAPAKKVMLRSIGEQAAVVLGTIMLCIERARRLAIEHERNRIAREMHDVISQSLFGIVLSLDACIKMLPQDVATVEQELIELRNLASDVHQQVRQSILDIWPSELTLERFKSDLRKYARHVNQARMFHIEFNTGGDFDGLSPRIRRTLYRIAQEAVANAIRHGKVDSVRLCLQVTEDVVYMSVQDRGRGFRSEDVLCREYNRERFGIRGILERVRNLGGHCEVYSRPNAGTLVWVAVPANGAHSDEW